MKRVVSTIVLLAMLLSVDISTFALTYGEEHIGDMGTREMIFTDVSPSHWAYEETKRCQEKGWFNGYPDGRFLPENSISRAEAAKVFVEFLGREKHEVQVSNYHDVDANAWYAPFIHAGANLFPQKNRSNNAFQPDMPITREDTVYALVTALGYAGDTKFADESILNMFSDQNSISSLIRPYMAVAISEGLVSGYEDSTIRAQDALTRAQFAALLYRATFVGTKTAVLQHVTISPSSAQTLTVGESFTFTAKAIYSDNSAENYTDLKPYVSDYRGVVSINGTTITAEKEGTCTIMFDNDILSGTSISVSVQKPTDAPKIIITEYPDNTEADNVQISGTVNDSTGTGIELTCNNRDIAINGNTFAYTAYLSLGLNSFEFTAKNGYGNKTVKQISINRNEKEKPTEAPKIKITEYPDSTEAESVQISGTVTDSTGTAVDLTCNGRDLTINSGAFTYTAYLSLGENVFEFVAENTYGNKSTKSITIIRKEAAPTTVEMPLLVGKNVESAKSNLADLGLSAEVQTIWNDAVSQGTVVSQSIREGEQVEIGKSVTIIVSGGKNDWVGWVDSLPSYVSAADYVIEEKTQYRYKHQETKSSSNPSMSGWTLVNTTENWSSWSAWSQNATSSSSTREVETKSVADPQQSKTQWHYTRYYGWNPNKGANVSWPWKGTYSTTYQESGWRDAPLENRGKGDGVNATVYKDPSDTISIWWWNETTRSVALPLTYHTEYRYRDKTITYNYSRWGDWSDWSDTATSASSTTKVESKTVYRYKFK